MGVNRMRISTNFHRMTKRESQAILSYNAGNLRLRMAWGEYYQDKSCLVRFCDQKDNLYNSVEGQVLRGYQTTSSVVGSSGQRKEEKV